MTCPSCQAELIAGQERCPGCGSMVAPPVMGALAPDPSRATPPARPRGGVAPIRDVPGLRRRDASWKDEVRERVQKRRRKKSSDLPLFDAPCAPEEPGARAAEPVTEEPPGAEPLVLRHEPAEAPADEIGAAIDGLRNDAPPQEEAPEPSGPSLLGDAPAEPEAVEPRLVFDTRSEPLGEPDLPLRPSPPDLRLPTAVADDPVARARAAPPEPLDEEQPLTETEEPDDWTPHIEIAPRPVERPAAFGDRFEAAAVDAGVLLLVYATVVYFASRTAQAELPALFHAWPWLVGYLACLGLAYAAWFTGTTGQTPGKMLFGLRVVESDGRPPGYLRALARAALGALGSAALGLGALPLFFDPARRALHDRLLRTRVVKS